ncbi:HNRPL protein, partial [Pseudoatta argentina]
MLECLSVCRCSLLVVDLMVMMDSHVERGVEGPVVNERRLRQIYGSFPPLLTTTTPTTTIYGDFKFPLCFPCISSARRFPPEICRNCQERRDKWRDIWLASFVFSVTAWDYATYPSKVIIVSSTNCRSVAGSSTHKNDATGNGRPAPLLAEPRYGAAPQPYGSTPQVTFPPGAGHDRYEENFNGPATYAEPYVERYGIKSDFSGREPLHPTPPRPGYVPTLGQTPPSSTQGSVMMVYGLQPDKVNTDKLFNLFCLYGNVTKVKFLKTKEGCAMIQMGDSIAVERCLQNLNNVTIGTDGRLQLGFSKQAFLSDVTNPYILPDKTASFKDFTGSKNNRFLNPAMANKNRIQPPSKIVHFFNTPPDLTEETVNRVFVERGIEAPTTIKLFPLKSERSSSGLIEFSSVGIAVAAIMECNHTALENSNGKFPYIMKLCFSSSRTIPTSFPPSSGSVSSNSAGNGHAKMQQDSE